MAAGGFEPHSLQTHTHTLSNIVHGNTVIEISISQFFNMNASQIIMQISQLYANTIAEHACRKID